jgi:hypothetical protein
VQRSSAFDLFNDLTRTNDAKLGSMLLSIGGGNSDTDDEIAAPASVKSFSDPRGLSPVQDTKLIKPKQGIPIASRDGVGSAGPERGHDPGYCPLRGLNDGVHPVEVFPRVVRTMKCHFSDQYGERLVVLCHARS